MKLPQGHLERVEAEPVIRRYQPGDKQAVWDLHVKAFSKLPVYVDLGKGPWDDDFQDIEGTYLKPGGDFLVLTIDGKIVAMGALKKLSEVKAEIKRMRTDPDFQRRGFAQTILSRLETRAKELGFKILQLDTSVVQDAAVKLYKKNGYKEVSRKNTHGIESVDFEKTILKR